MQSHHIVDIVLVDLISGVTLHLILGSHTAHRAATDNPLPLKRGSWEELSVLRWAVDPSTILCEVHDMEVDLDSFAVTHHVVPISPIVDLNSLKSAI